VTDLSVSLGPLRLEHPVINCSGTMELFELAEVFGPSIVERPPVAAYVPKTVTLEPRTGNPPPRILETAGGMINAIGLPGPGLGVFLTQELARLLALPCPVIVSIGGFSTGEYVALATGLRLALSQTSVEGWIRQVGLELNISCPNVHSGCASVGGDPGETGAVVQAVRAVWPGRETHAQRDRYRGSRAGRRGGRRRRVGRGEHLQGDGPRPPHAEAILGEHHGWFLGSGYQATGPKGRLRVVPGG
jgi:hypothetical protein